MIPMRPKIETMVAAIPPYSKFVPNSSVYNEFINKDL
jgi:hypothetical protein